ncbi:MAG: hypothetical protein CMJ78_22730 [Planctomycetaceae bacterium]|nr:hypothetical protein [Planctomycetaceae bacterium]
MLIISSALVWNPFGNDPPASWGWLAKSSLDESLAPPEYLNRIADGGEQWFNKRPKDRVELSQRIREFSLGCGRLIEARHSCLSEADRNWLLDRCLAWSTKLTEEQARLDHQHSVNDGSQGGLECVAFRVLAEPNADLAANEQASAKLAQLKGATRKRFHEPGLLKSVLSRE